MHVLANSVIFLTLYEQDCAVKIAFLGKGGSGKTTAAAAFTRYVSTKRSLVLAIDADVNVHLKQALGIDFGSDILELGNAYEDIIEYLKGERDDLGDAPMVASTPPCEKSNFVTVSLDDPFIRKYATVRKNIAFLTVGSYDKEDVGSSCYHGKLYSLAALMHHLIDTEDDVVIADTTAGTDNVATSLHLAYDLNLFVVEPTEKSTKVFHDFVSLSPELKEKTYFISNKVRDDRDIDFLKNKLPEDRCLGNMSYSPYLKRFEQGKKDALEEFDKTQVQVWESVLKQLRLCDKDWGKYMEDLKASHSKVSKKWLNPFYSMSVDKQVETNFQYGSADIYSEKT